MVKRILLLSVGFLCLIKPGFSQVSKVLLWRVELPQQNPKVYRPEPILFVHGVNDDDGDCWPYAIMTMYPDLANYQVPDVLPVDTTNQRAEQKPYLHTFNYGGKTAAEAGAGHNSNSFFHIAWNASQDDRNNLTFTNRISLLTPITPNNPTNPNNPL